MSAIKTFLIKGFVNKSGSKITFSIKVRALKEEHALVKLLSEIGSRHKAKRREVKVTSIREVPEPTSNSEATQKEPV